MVRVEDGAGKDRLPKGFVKILKEECKGCSVCIDACSHGQLYLSDGINQKGYRYVQQLDADKCTGCSLCYIQCPSSAIVVYRLKKPGMTVQRI